MATRKTSQKKSASKTSARKRSANSRPRDALALLKADHKKVDDLVKKFEKARSASQK